MSTRSEPQFPIRVVARRTGLSTHVIRIWERRYEALAPQRTDSNRRLYTEADIERLQLLRRAVEEGHSIGRVARIPAEELGQLLPPEAPPVPAYNPAEGETRAQGFLQAARGAVADLDRVILERVLAEASAALPVPLLLERVVTPLMDCIGEDWRTGRIRVANEHLASAVVRSFLALTKSRFRPAMTDPAIVFATPNGQDHELGALMAALVAVAGGWRDVYLGSNLPAEEIAGAAVKSGARAVAISVVYPGDDPRLMEEIQRLRDLLPENVVCLVGGRSAGAYSGLWQQQRFEHIQSLEQFGRRLAALRGAD